MKKLLLNSVQKGSAFVLLALMVACSSSPDSGLEPVKPKPTTETISDNNVDDYEQGNSYRSTVSFDNFKTIPLPKSITPKYGIYMTLSSQTCIVCEDDQLRKTAEILQGWIKQQTCYELAIKSEKPTSGNIINLAIVDNDAVPESYVLEVSNQQIDIIANTPAGVFYGATCLRKALPVHAVNKAPIIVGGVKVIDEPRFKYRGAMLDVSRHFFSIEVVKKVIDMLAFHQLNRFHWHLTDDQGWRIEIKKYPKLISIGSKRARTWIRKTNTYLEEPYEGHYTQAQIRDVVQYAADRYITIIPEIDMPGHMRAAVASYPELGCNDKIWTVGDKWGVYWEVLDPGKDIVYTFAKDVLTEIMDLFPSEYIHIGGDECPRHYWETSVDCQNKIKELGLKEKAEGSEHSPEDLLQNYFTKEIEKFLNAHGRKLIGWNEILEGNINKSATIMSWTGVSPGIQAAKAGHDVVMSPSGPLYFDSNQHQNHESYPEANYGIRKVTDVYAFDPVPSSLSKTEAKHILGPQANLWSEYVPTEEVLMNQYLPRMAALSEISWTPTELKDYNSFVVRMYKMRQFYDLNQWNYSPIEVME